MAEVPPKLAQAVHFGVVSWQVLDWGLTSDLIEVELTMIMPGLL